jgi:hypothetical protein
MPVITTSACGGHDMLLREFLPKEGRPASRGTRSGPETGASHADFAGGASGWLDTTGWSNAPAAGEGSEGGVPACVNSRRASLAPSRQGTARPIFQVLSDFVMARPAPINPIGDQRAPKETTARLRRRMQRRPERGVLPGHTPGKAPAAGV